MPYIHNMTLTSPKLARLETRLPRHTKELIEQASRLSGQTVSSFVASTLHERALEMVGQSHRLQLSQQDSAAFAKALLKPAKPNKALRKAVSRHRKAVKE